MPALLDIDAIREILPHRYPFLLVDSILELEEDRIVGIKNVSYNEPFMMGHFPDYPVLKSIPDRHKKLVLLASVEEAKFRRQVRPGDTLRIEMMVGKRKASVAKLYGKATVDGVVVAEARVMCKLADRAIEEP
jgi:3-hydroxymyristoyl/3-hydroxydecanoyl-(acyl carrier protein) dehydratase